MRLEAEFACSALKLSDCPPWRRIEAAVSGRSNVGKSSLLNALAGRRNLARTSKTPGRTRCLNFFTVGEGLALVDLPGYGYAKMSHAEAADIARLMDAYLRGRENLTALILLIDARRGPEREEIALAEMSRGRGLELIVVATKADKLRSAGRARALRRFESAGMTPIMCSVNDGEGVEELRRRIVALGKLRSRDPAKRLQ
jgi:GTP-binding protein